MIGLTVLGATGSIGINTLKVAAQNPDVFSFVALSAKSNWQKMQQLCEQYQPEFAVLLEEQAADKLRQTISHLKTKVLHGSAALVMIAEHDKTDYVMAAIVGSAGLSATLAAANAGKRLLLANKESLVLSGNLLLESVKKSGALLLPVDSEHSAIFQCFEAGCHGLTKVQLTASGGPFLNFTRNECKNISPQMACTHPNWQMGAKISVDSATLMNKGLEMIEAHYLFALTPRQIEAIVHPQSIIHALVHYQDGSVLAQLGVPDMRTAISYALSYPKRQKSGVKALDLSAVASLDFAAPNLDKFPCFALASQALTTEKNSVFGALNAANEVAVAAFLAGQIGFLDIAHIIDSVLQKHQAEQLFDLAHIIDNDKQTRMLAKQMTQQLASLR